MAPYRIEVTAQAKTDLDQYRARERGTITQAIREQLTHQPSVETKNRKKLRDNPVASWELRCGRHRVFYELEETNRTVTILAVGHKEHERLLIRGLEVKI